MKKVILTIMFLFVVSLVSAQQTYNFDTQVKKPKTEVQLISTSVKTSDFAIYKTVKYPVYESNSGKLFIVYINNKGNYSKKYIPSQL